MSHLEYFYNTLDCSFATKNPFDSPDIFPALLFRKPISSDGSSGCESHSALTLPQNMTLLEMHRLIIFPTARPARTCRRACQSQSQARARTSLPSAPRCFKSTDSSVRTRCTLGSCCPRSTSGTRTRAFRTRGRTGWPSRLRPRTSSALPRGAIR